MINAKDIEILKEIFATKEELGDLELRLNTRFDQIIGHIDGFMRKLENTSQETIINGYRTDRLEKWAKKVGNKTKINFET